MPKQQAITIALELHLQLAADADVSDERVKYVLDQIRANIEAVPVFAPKAKASKLSDRVVPTVRFAEAIGTRGDGQTFRNTFRRPS